MRQRPNFAKMKTEAAQDPSHEARVSLDEPDVHGDLICLHDARDDTCLFYFETLGHLLPRHFPRSIGDFDEYLAEIKRNAARLKRLAKKGFDIEKDSDEDMYFCTIPVDVSHWQTEYRKLKDILKEGC